MTHNCVPDVTQLKFVQQKLFNYSDLNELLPLLLRKNPGHLLHLFLLLLPPGAPARPRQNPANNRHSLISAVAY